MKPDLSAEPRISVVTPTKNRLLLLQETMDSVAAQSLGDWEHIIVDDGSDDGTEAMVRARAAADPRVRFIQRAGERGGANICRNIGLSEARADLIIFLDSDDLLVSGALAARCKLMERNPDLDFAASRTGVFSQQPGDITRADHGNETGDDLLRFLSFDTPWQTSAPTWRRAAIMRLRGFDEALPSWQDIDLHIRAIAGGLRYIRLPETDHYMRWQEEPGKISAAQRRSPEHLYAALALFEKLHEVVSNGPGMTWSRQRAICGLYFFVAERWIDIGRLPEALAAWRTAQRRMLSSMPLFVCGAIMLMLMRPARLRSAFVERLTNKWKGWVRFRIEPNLLRTRQRS